MVEQELKMMLESPAGIDELPVDPVDDPMRPVAEKRAAKILKKNSREINRLQKHAEECLYTMNREGYIYAIGKIRTIIRKPLSDEALGVLFDTSIERLIELANEAIEKQK
ncbi:MAG: DUF2654 domain-containing protein [Aeromonas veronii]